MPCSILVALATNVSHLLHKRATLLSDQKPSQLPLLETCSALMSSVLQLPSELVPNFFKAQNATAVKLLMSQGSMQSSALKMQATSLDIQSSTPFSKGH